MKNKEVNLKEKLKQALNSTVRVISDDFKSQINSNDNKNKVPRKYLKLFKRTKNISSSKLRKKIKKNINLIFN